MHGLPNKIFANTLDCVFFVDHTQVSSSLIEKLFEYNICFSKSFILVFGIETLCSISEVMLIGVFSIFNAVYDSSWF